jgi:hypothetical protein
MIPVFYTFTFYFKRQPRENWRGFYLGSYWAYDHFLCSFLFLIAFHAYCWSVIKQFFKILPKLRLTPSFCRNQNYLILMELVNTHDAFKKGALVIMHKRNIEQCKFGELSWKLLMRNVWKDQSCPKREYWKNFRTEGKTSALRLCEVLIYSFLFKWLCL